MDSKAELTWVYNNRFGHSRILYLLQFKQGHRCRLHTELQIATLIMPDIKSTVGRNTLSASRNHESDTQLTENAAILTKGVISTG